MDGAEGAVAGGGFEVGAVGDGVGGKLVGVANKQW